MSDAIMGTFVKIGTMADGTPRLVLDLQCTLSEIAAMGLIPGVPFALARMSKDASIAPSAEPVSKPEEPKQKPGELCVMACTFCKDPLFWQWISSETSSDEVTNEIEAREFILYVCSVDSRKKLDQFSSAAHTFHEYIRKPFLAWRDRK